MRDKPIRTPQWFQGIGQFKALNMYVQTVERLFRFKNSLTPFRRLRSPRPRRALTSIQYSATAASSGLHRRSATGRLEYQRLAGGEYGGVPAGPSTSNPTQGYTTGLKSWAARKGVPACVSTAPTPEGAAPTSIASFAPPPVRLRSLVTQGHPSYSATAPKAARRRSGTQYVYGSDPLP